MLSVVRAKLVLIWMKLIIYILLDCHCFLRNSFHKLYPECRGFTSQAPVRIVFHLGLLKIFLEVNFRNNTVSTISSWLSA